MPRHSLIPAGNPTDSNKPGTALANLPDAPNHEQGRDDEASPRYIHGYVVGANSDWPSTDGGRAKHALALGGIYEQKESPRSNR